MSAWKGNSAGAASLTIDVHRLAAGGAAPVGLLLRQPVLETDLGQAAQVGEWDVAMVGAKGGEIVAEKVRALVAEGDTVLTGAGQNPALGAPVAVEGATTAFAADLPVR